MSSRMIAKLTFGQYGNGKLDRGKITFSLPAGWACPGAALCLSRADKTTGRITDGPTAEWRCFAAMGEAFRPAVRLSRWRNFDLLQRAKTAKGMAELILTSLPHKAKAVRIHVSGDFFNRAYFDAWRMVAVQRTATVFYAYTKSVHVLPPKRELPGNLRIVVSSGSKFGDDKARSLGYSIAHVVFDLNTPLPIDHTDEHAMLANHDFALLLHSSQPAGSEASRALQALKAQGYKGYSK